MGAITTAIGTALTLGAASTAAGSGIAGLSVASTIGAGVVGGGLLYGAKKLMGGLSGSGQQQAQITGPSFNADAEQKKADVAAEEEERRRRVGAAKNKGILSDPNDEAKLGKTALFGS